MNGSESPYRVLIIGPRPGLLDAAKKLQLRIDIWRAPGIKKPQSLSKYPELICENYYTSRKKILDVIETYALHKKNYSHVIAGGESSVICAAICRRLLGCRYHPMSTIWRCRDKLLMKQYLHKRGIPMTAFGSCKSLESYADALDQYGENFVVKPRKLSGGRHFGVIKNEDTWNQVNKKQAIVESFVNGQEASVESFIKEGQIMFRNITQYRVNRYCNYVPAAFSSALVEKIDRLNEAVIKQLGIRWGMTHLEVYLTKRNNNINVLFGEIALRPPGGYIMDAIELAWGFNPWQAYIAMELNLPFNFPVEHVCYSSVEIFHPGHGKLISIEGIDELRNISEITILKFKKKQGDCITPRDGSGEDIGHCLYRTATVAEREYIHRKISKKLIFTIKQ
jgi:hypothetical protein